MPNEFWEPLPRTISTKEFWAAHFIKRITINSHSIWSLWRTQLCCFVMTRALYLFLMLLIWIGVRNLNSSLISIKQTVLNLGVQNNKWQSSWHSWLRNIMIFNIFDPRELDTSNAHSHAYAHHNFLSVYHDSAYMAAAHFEVKVTDLHGRW
jgi:hypothetical protein